MNVKVDISIIVPMYNARTNIERCLNSIRKQTKNNIEIIVINDGSSDNSGEICKRLVADDERIKYIEQANSGVASARNKGIDIAKGECIAFVDADDYLEISCLEKLWKCYKESFTDVVSCCCRVVPENKIYHFYDGSKVFGKEHNFDEVILQLLDSSYGQKEKGFTGIGVPWGKLYSTEVIKKYNIRFPDIRRQQDNIFNLEILNHIRRFIYLDLPLYNYETSNILDFYKYYHSDYDKILKKVHQLRFELLKKGNWLENERIKKQFKLVTLSNAYSIISRKYFSKYYRVAYKDRVSKSILLLQDGLYAELIGQLNYSEMNSVKKKIVLFLIKNRQFPVIFMINLKKDRKLKLKN